MNDSSRSYIRACAGQDAAAILAALAANFATVKDIDRKALASTVGERAEKALPWCEFCFGVMHPANEAAICRKLLRVQRRFPRIAEALGFVGVEADGPGWPGDSIAATWTHNSGPHPLGVSFRLPRWRDNDAGFAGETMLHEMGHVAAWVIDLDADGRAKRARWVARKSEEQWAEGAKTVLGSGRGNGPVAAMVREYCSA